MTILHPPIPKSVLDRSTPAWLPQILRCRGCGKGSPRWVGDAFRCRGCHALYPVRAGAVDMRGAELAASTDMQQRAWACLERARSRFGLPFEEVAKFENAKNFGPAFKWLRRMLQTRGRSRVLEFGSEHGWASARLAADGHDVVATDISDSQDIGLGYASRLAAHMGDSMACVATQAESLPFRSDSFDIVFCVATLCHIVDLERVLCEVSRVLRPGGMFFALQEAFRGILTTPAQRLQNCTSSLLVRGWQYFPPGARMPLVTSQMRSYLGTALFELCRRVPYWLQAAESAGLQCRILPIGPFLALPGDFRASPAGVKNLRSAWLQTIAEGYSLNVKGLEARVEKKQIGDRSDLLPRLAAHWIVHGNWDGVIFGHKPLASPASGEPSWISGTEQAWLCRSNIWTQLMPGLASLQNPDELRRLDPFLLECSPRGLLPVYGLYGIESDSRGSYSWTMPQAGFLVRHGGFLELELACPAAPFQSEPARVEVSLDDERAPRLVSMIPPGRTATLRFPVSGRRSAATALLVRLHANLGFLPSDATGSPSDIRLLALKLRSVRVIRD